MESEDAKRGRLAREKTINSAAKKLVREYLAGRSPGECMAELVTAVRVKPTRPRPRIPPEKAEDYRTYRRAGYSTAEAAAALGLDVH